MKKILIIVSIFLVGLVNAQTNCASALPFCAGNQSGVTFPATVNGPAAQSGPNYGCLGSQPNPAWYYLQVSQSGNLDLAIAGTGGGDVDFIAWGPFSSLAGACNSLTSGNTVDCSYSSSPTETLNITAAVAGQYYMVLLTNFSNQPQNITFNQYAGTGATNCGLVANNSTICAGQTATLTTSNTGNLTNPSYSINPGGQTSPTPTFFVSPSITTVYTLYVTGINNQNATVTQTTTATVTVFAQPALAPTFTQATCQTNTNAVNLGLTFNPNNPVPQYTVNWNPAPQTVVNTGTPPVTATNAAFGVNSVTVTASGGCKATISFTMINVTPPTLTLTNSSPSFSVTCLNPSVCITAATTPSNANLFWSNSINSFTSNAQTNCLTNAANYTVVATGPSNTCAVTQTFAIVTNTTPPTATVAPTSQTINCNVNSAAVFTNGITSPTSNVQTSWYCPNASFPNAPTAVVPGAVSIYSAFCGVGQYTVVSTNLVNGCKTTSVLNVFSTTSFPTFNATSTSNFTVGCAPNNTTTLCMANGTSSNGSIQYAFSAPGSNPSFPLPNGNFNGTSCITTSLSGTWTLSAMDPVSFCQTRTEVTIIQNTVLPHINYSILTHTLTCNNPTVLAIGSSTIQNPIIFWNYPLSGPNTLNSATIEIGPANGPPTSTTALSYGVYTLTVVDPNNSCRSVVTVTINQDFRPPVATFGLSSPSVVTCVNPTVQITVTNATYSGSPQPISVTNTLIAPGSSVSVGGIGVNTIAGPQGTYTVITQSNANGCIGIKTPTIGSDFDYPIIAPIPPAILDCSVNPAAPISVALQATLNSAWTVLFKSYPIGTSFNPSSLSVPPNGFTVAATSSVSPIFTVDKPGVYEFFVRNNFTGCISVATIQVNTGILNANFIPSATSGFAPLAVNFNNTSASSATAGASASITSVWNFGNGTSLTSTNSASSPSALYNNPGTYTVVLVASKGECIDSTYKIITVEIPSKLEVPNVFTPNGDKNNDVFFLKTTNLTEVNALIFDRWGNKVYELNSTTGNIAWDGKNQAGIDCSAGTYFYVIKAKGKDGQEYEKKGNVSLYR